MANRLNSVNLKFVKVAIDQATEDLKVIKESANAKTAKDVQEVIDGLVPIRKNVRILCRQNWFRAFDV